MELVFEMFVSKDDTLYSYLIEIKKKGNVRQIDLFLIEVVEN